MLGGGLIDEKQIYRGERLVVFVHDTKRWGCHVGEFSWPIKAYRKIGCDCRSKDRPPSI